MYSVQEVSCYAVCFSVKTAMEEDCGVLANYSTIINNECDPGAKRQMWSLDPEQTYFQQERENNGIPEQNTGNVQKWLPHTILITLKDEYQIKEVLKKDNKYTGGKKKKKDCIYSGNQEKDLSVRSSRFPRQHQWQNKTQPCPCFPMGLSKYGRDGTV